MCSRKYSQLGECEKEEEDCASQLSDRRYDVTSSRWWSIAQKSVDPTHLRMIGLTVKAAALRFPSSLVAGIVDSSGVLGEYSGANCGGQVAVKQVNEVLGHHEL